eukprot:7011103-Prymnesium_polylepis.1
MLHRIRYCVAEEEHELVVLSVDASEADEEWTVWGVPREDQSSVLALHDFAERAAYLLSSQHDGATEVLEALREELRATFPSYRAARGQLEPFLWGRGSSRGDAELAMAKGVPDRTKHDELAMAKGVHDRTKHDELAMAKGVPGRTKNDDEPSGCTTITDHSSEAAMVSRTLLELSERTMSDYTKATPKVTIAESKEVESALKAALKAVYATLRRLDSGFHDRLAAALRMSALSGREQSLLELLPVAIAGLPDDVDVTEALSRIRDAVNLVGRQNRFRRRWLKTSSFRLCNDVMLALTAKQQELLAVKIAEEASRMAEAEAEDDEYVAPSGAVPGADLPPVIIMYRFFNAFSIEVPQRDAVVQVLLGKLKLAEDVRATDRED